MPRVEATQSLRIMILEDDLHRGELLRASFEERETNYELLFVKTVASARRGLRQRAVDLILASVLVSDGPAASLAGDSADETAPLIIMTRPGEEATALGALASGAFAQVMMSEETLERLPGIISTHHRNWLRDRNSPASAPRAREEAERSVFDALPDGLIEFGRDRRIRSINRRGALALGSPPERLIGRPVEDVVSAVLAATILEALDESRREDAEVRVECRYPDPEGGRWSELRFTPVDPGTPEAPVICVEREITQRRDLDAALELSEARLRALCDSLPLDLWFSDGEGSCLRQNDRSVLTWGSLEGGRIEDGLPPALAEGWTHAADRACKGQVVDGEIVVEARGRKSVLKTRVAPVRNGEAILGTLQLAMDRTRERKLELDLERLEDEMLQTQKMEVLGQLTTGIAHDFKNVLTAIGGDVTRAEEALLDQVSDGPSVDQCLSSIQDSVDRAVGLASHLLGFSRHRVSRPEAIDLKAMLGRIEGLLTRLITPNIRLGVYVMSGTKPVRLDRSHLEQILLNLVVNASDAMPSGGDLMIKAWNTRGEELAACAAEGVRFRDAVTLSVSDTGTGIPEQLQKKIYDAFFTTKPPGSGTGLGLSTTRNVVQKARGHLLLESTVGEGTTFRVVLPAAEETPRRAPSLPSGELPKRRSEPPTILLCEDDDAVRGLMDRWLVGLGYRVLSTSSPRRALAMADSESAIDLLLTDMSMPEMSGVELRRRMREKRPGLRTLLVTGLDQSELDLGELGDFSLLPKPFDSAGLLEAVRELAGDA